VRAGSSRGKADDQAFVALTHAPTQDAVLAPTTPTRSSTFGLAANVGDNHAGNDKFEGLVGAGMDTHAGCSTPSLTSSPVDPGARASHADTDMLCGLPCQLKEHPADRRPLLPQISFPRFNGDDHGFGEISASTTSRNSI
jgi:hypothetical protein